MGNELERLREEEKNRQWQEQRKRDREQFETEIESYILSLIAFVMGIRPFVMTSESMHPEVLKNSLILLNTTSKIEDVAVGDSVAYVLGKVEDTHKTTRLYFNGSEIRVKQLRCAYCSKCK